MSRHRSPRPRYGRMLLAAAALFVTVVAVLGGVGVVPTAPSAAEGTRTRNTPVPSETPSTTDPASPTASPTPVETDQSDVPATTDPETSAPARSGSGRRVVFSESEQRVWLVRSNGTVRRTYLVSGSLEDNLDPGRYSVFSRSRWAVGIDDSGVMEYFVRFAHGQRASIGFHTIPTKLGTPLQARSDLGTPQSHGCIRQAKADAISLWKFALEGTPVVVV